MVHQAFQARLKWNDIYLEAARLLSFTHVRQCRTKGYPTEQRPALLTERLHIGSKEDRSQLALGFSTIR